MATMLQRARSHLADPLHRNAWLLAANSASGAVFGFLFWLLAARAASPGVVGAGAALVSAATLAALLGKFGLDAGLVRFAAATDRRGRFRLLATAVAASAALASLVAGGVLAARGLLGPDFPALSRGEEAAFVLFAGCLAAAWVLDAYFVAERRAGRSLARNVVHHSLRLALPLVVFFLFATPFGILAAWGAGAAASLVVAAVLAAPLLRAARASGEPLPSRAAVARYGALNYAVNILEWLPSLALPLVVFAVLGAEENARFYVAWTLASLGFFASKAIASSAFAEMSATRPRADVLRGAALHSAWLLVPFAVGLALAGPLALSLFGPPYTVAWPTLLLLAVSIAPVAVVNLRLTLLKHEAGSGIRGAGAELVLLPLLLVGASFALAWPLLARLGSPGVAAAWLAANAAAAAWCLLAARRAPAPKPAARVEATP